jgi:hypothetical protein
VRLRKAGERHLSVFTLRKLCLAIILGVVAIGVIHAVRSTAGSSTLPSRLHDRKFDGRAEVWGASGRER